MLDPNTSTATTGTGCTNDSQARSAIPSASFLDLPAEVRLMIYDSIVVCTGTVTIYARYAIGRNVSRETLSLLHINQLIRSEVEDFFYMNQEFTFRSIPAIANFIDGLGPRRAALVRHIKFDTWLCQRFALQFDEKMRDMLRQLRGVERVAIEDPIARWRRHRRGAVRYDESGILIPLSSFAVPKNYGNLSYGFRLGPSGRLILAIWEKFVEAGKVFMKVSSRQNSWRQSNELIFLSEQSEQCQSVVEQIIDKGHTFTSIWQHGRTLTSLLEVPELETVRRAATKHTSIEMKREIAKTASTERRKRQRKLRG